MVAESYKVTGLKVLSQQLRSYDKDMGKYLRKANLRAANVIADEARQLAPQVTGALARSIGAQASQTSATVKAGSASRVPYANPVHWGWNIRPQGGSNPPTPFIQRALKAKYGDMVIAYDEAMEELRKNKKL